MVEMLPWRPHRGATKSEKLIFDLLKRDQGLEGYYCLHSLGLARHKRKSYAECDFVVIGPSGVYCLEVKGGEIKRRAGLWRIGWPSRQYESSEGPFKQAQSARGALLRELSNRLGSTLKQRVPVGWGVVFPDIEFNEKDPEWDPECICDRRDLRNPISDFLSRLAKYTREHEGRRGRVFPERLKRFEVEGIVKAFRNDFDLVPKFSDLVEESQSELVRLTEEQYAALSAILHINNPRVLCEGGAGTGKTVLAMESARRLCDNNSRILFLCFNRNLCGYLKRQEFASNTSITVDTAWNYLSSLVHRAGHGWSPDSMTKTDLIQLAEEAIVHLIENQDLKTYDNLIIDEAQDVLDGQMMGLLDWLLAGGLQNGRWAMFLDKETQAGIYKKLDVGVYSHLSKISVNLPLSVNLRNPERIVREASRFAGIKPAICRREFEARIEYWKHKGSEEIQSSAEKIIRRLLHEGVSGSDIALLSFNSPDKAFFKEGLKGIRLPISVLDNSASRPPERGTIVAASIAAFKGLEVDIAIVGDLPKLPLDKWGRATLYVALTRARTAVYLLVPSEFLTYRRKVFLGEDGE